MKRLRKTVLELGGFGHDLFIGLQLQHKDKALKPRHKGQCKLQVKTLPAPNMFFLSRFMSSVAEILTALLSCKPRSRHAGAGLDEGGCELKHVRLGGLENPGRRSRFPSFVQQDGLGFGFGVDPVDPGPDRFGHDQGTSARSWSSDLQLSESPGRGQVGVFRGR